MTEHDSNLPPTSQTEKPHTSVLFELKMGSRAIITVEKYEKTEEPVVATEYPEECDARYIESLLIQEFASQKVDIDLLSDIADGRSDISMLSKIESIESALIELSKLSDQALTSEIGLWKQHFAKAIALVDTFEERLQSSTCAIQDVAAMRDVCRDLLRTFNDRLRLVAEGKVPILPTNNQ